MINIAAARETIRRLIKEKREAEVWVQQAHDMHMAGTASYDVVRHARSRLQMAYYRVDGAVQMWKALTGEEWKEQSSSK
jgi:hypothetical protein